MEAQVFQSCLLGSALRQRVETRNTPTENTAGGGGSHQMTQGAGFESRVSATDPVLRLIPIF